MRALCLLLLLVGCETVRPCRTQTLLVTVRLADGAVLADQLVVGVAIDGGTARYTTINHVIGQTEGTVEIDFSSGYPAGRAVVLTVDAIMGGQRVGTGSTMLVPAADCDTPTVDVAASG